MPASAVPGANSGGNGAASITPERLAQLKSMFMDYGWRNRQKAAGNGGLEYFDEASGQYIIPQFSSRMNGEDVIEDVSGFATYDSNDPLVAAARANNDNFDMMGAPMSNYDAAGNSLGDTTFASAHKNGPMDYILPAAMMAAPFALTAMGVAGAAGAAGAAGGVGGVTGLGEAGAMYAGLDAAAAGSLGGGASIGGGAALSAAELAALGGGGSAGIGGAGITGFGDAGTMYAGADPAAAGSLGGGASVGGGAGAGPGVMPPNPLSSSPANSLIPGIPDKLLGPGLNIIGGALTADAAGKSADAGLQSVRESNALLKEIFDKQVELQEPFRQGGLKGLNRLQELLGIGGNATASDYGSAARDFSLADFQADPGYAFRQSEQEKALQRSASAAGLLGSGKYLKDSMRYSGDLASQEYGNSFNRFQTNRASRLNPLQSMAGMGQTSANTLGQAAQNYGNTASSNVLAGGDFRAAGIMGRSNALSGAIGQGISMYQGNQMMERQDAYQNALLNALSRR